MGLVGIPGNPPVAIPSIPGAPPPELMEAMSCAIKSPPPAPSAPGTPPVIPGKMEGKGLGGAREGVDGWGMEKGVDWSCCRGDGREERSTSAGSSDAFTGVGGTMGGGAVTGWVGASVGVHGAGMGLTSVTQDATLSLGCSCDPLEPCVTLCE